MPCPKFINIVTVEVFSSGEVCLGFKFQTEKRLSEDELFIISPDNAAALAGMLQEALIMLRKQKGGDYNESEESQSQQSPRLKPN